MFFPQKSIHRMEFAIKGFLKSSLVHVSVLDPFADEHAHLDLVRLRAERSGQARTQLSHVTPLHVLKGELAE